MATTTLLQYSTEVKNIRIGEQFVYQDETYTRQFINEEMETITVHGEHMIAATDESRGVRLIPDNTMIAPLIHSVQIPADNVEFNGKFYLNNKLLTRTRFNSSTDTGLQLDTMWLDGGEECIGAIDDEGMIVMIQLEQKVDIIPSP